MNVWEKLVKIPLFPITEGQEQVSGCVRVCVGVCFRGWGECLRKRRWFMIDSVGVSK